MNFIFAKRVKTKIFKKRFKNIFIYYFLFIFISPLFLLNKNLLASENNLKIVGVVDNALPCSDFNDSSYIGLSLDFWREVAEKANIHYTTRTINSFNEGINEAEKGNVDLLVSCFDITTSRLRRIEYTIPYRQENNAFLSRKKDFLGQLVLLNILRNKVLIYSLALLAILSLICSLIVYRWDNGRFDFLNFTAPRREKLIRSWTIFMVGVWTPLFRSSMTKEMMLILIFSFLRLAIVSTLLGTAASEIFITKKPIEINKIGNEQIVNLLYEGVGVPKGTAQDTWFSEKIASLKNFDTNKIKLVKTEKGEEGLLELLLNGDVNHIFGEKSNLKNIKKAILNSSDFYISIEDPIKYNQGFVFGKNLDKKNKQSINVAISELLGKGRHIFAEKKWND